MRGRSLVNGGTAATPFVLQETATRWLAVVDTALPSPADIDLERPRLLDHPSYLVEGRSIVVLIAAT